LPRVAIAAGGTGGHLYPALAVYEVLRKAQPEVEVLWLCSRRAVDREVLRRAGVRRVVPLPTKPFPLRVGIHTLSSLVGLALSTFVALFSLAQFRPQCLLSLGSHVGLPAGLAARLLGIPLVVHEQNVLPGRAMRLLARLAHTVAISYPATIKLLPGGARRVEVTGTPVRREVEGIDRRRARRILGLEEGEFLLLALGGSLGARRINEAILGAWPSLKASIPGLKGVLVAGRWFEGLAKRDLEAKGLKVVRYAHDLPFLLAAADLVVSRAGASTLAELAARGVASILVPYPLAVGGHQRANALYFSRRGASVMVEDGLLTPSKLAEEVRELAFSPERRHNMGRAARGIFVPGAAERVAKIMLDFCR